ncbi:hypothetical protein SAMN05443270_0438 [Lacrimispora sphenoides]|uniref:hypothetical protein n=1 Tax=Lacrimispora sphenoides TaxID=29370 RepID=UPI0008B37BC5|nr:hypothetical protein [Lacrimispora sphenoides]SET54607.1 hypothetical protein SAMN05443270_0438 [Lacrimispora sphenoides]
MAKRVSNMNELAAALQPAMLGMVNEMEERVYQTLNYFLQEYYNSYDPEYYRRAYNFLYSAVKIEPKRVGNKVVASVYIDYDSMDSYVAATGYQVATWANQGLHGGLDVGNNTPHVWDDTIENTVDNGELLRLAAAYLKSEGFSVRG